MGEGGRTEGGEEDARGEQVGGGEGVPRERVRADEASPDVEGVVPVVGEEEGVGDTTGVASDQCWGGRGTTHVKREIVQHMPARVRRVRRIRLR